MTSLSTANSTGSQWEKLASELKDYGTKIDSAKAQFDDLSVNIDDFTRQLEEAAARERKITEMLNSFMAKIDNVSQQNNWDPNMSSRSHQSSHSHHSPPKLLSAPTYKLSPPNNNVNSISSPLRSSELGGSSGGSSYIGSSEFNNGEAMPQVHISRKGSISIMVPPTK